MLRYVLGLEPNGRFMTWLVRETLEQANSTPIIHKTLPFSCLLLAYAEAVELLSDTPILSPVYYIVGGNKSFEGAIIHRSINNTDLLVEMDPNSPNGWYLLQTNYDQGTEVSGRVTAG